MNGKKISKEQYNKIYLKGVSDCVKDIISVCNKRKMYVVSVDTLKIFQKQLKKKYKKELEK